MGLDSQRALFTLLCTGLVACGSSTVVILLDRFLYEEEENIVPKSQQEEKTDLVSSGQGVVSGGEAVLESEADGPTTLGTLKEDFSRRMKRKEREEKEQVESNILNVVPRVFRLIGQHLLTPVVLKRIDQLRELYF